MFQGNAGERPVDDDTNTATVSTAEFQEEGATDDGTIGEEQERRADR